MFELAWQVLTTLESRALLSDCSTARCVLVLSLHGGGGGGGGDGVAHYCTTTRATRGARIVLMITKGGSDESDALAFGFCATTSLATPLRWTDWTTELDRDGKGMILPNDIAIDFPSDAQTLKR